MGPINNIPALVLIMAWHRLAIIWTNDDYFTEAYMRHLADIGKTFGPLPDRRTSNPLENLSFTGPPKLLQDLIFFQY